MSEFDKLKDDAEKYAQDHPEQVQKGEQEAEKKLGLPDQGGSGPGQSGQQDQSSQQDQSGQQGQYDQGAGPGGEDQQNSGDGGGQ